MSFLKQSSLFKMNLNKCAGCGNELNEEINKVQHPTSNGLKEISFCKDCYTNAKEYGLIK